MINEQNSNLNKLDVTLGYNHWIDIPTPDQERIEAAALDLGEDSQIVYEEFMELWDVPKTAEELGISESMVIGIIETVHTNAGFNVYNY